MEDLAIVCEKNEKLAKKGEDLVDPDYLLESL